MGQDLAPGSAFGLVAHENNIIAVIFQLDLQVIHECTSRFRR